MRIAVCSAQIDKTATKRLLEHVDRLIAVKPFHKVHEAIAAHPDIQLCPVDRTSVVIHPDMDVETVKALKNSGIQVIFGQSRLEAAYPKDIPYNAALAGKRCFHLKGKTDPVLFRELAKRGYQFIPVRQGYGKCSTLPLGEDALISSDPTIEREALKEGLKVEKVPSGDILLPGFDYGFIGGCAGVMEEARMVFFNGDLGEYQYGENVRRFVESRGYRCCSLQAGPLVDVGSIFFLET